VPVAALIDVDYGSRVAATINLCTLVNELGGTQVPVPAQTGSYDHPSTLIKFLRTAASVVGIPVPTDNIDYTHFTSLANAIITAINAAAQPALPANTVAPVITGSVSVGNTLTVSNGTWTPAGVALTRQWIRQGGTNIGTGANTYVTVPADESNTITCRVTGTNETGSTPVTTTAFGPITP
jgi:hypothetical protein